MSALDQSLDEIMSSKPRSRGIRKRGRGLKTKHAAIAAKQAAATATAAAAATKARAPATTVKPAVASVDPASLFDQGSKIIVSNLPPDVSEQQIKDLFNVQIGRVVRVSLAYGPQGQSKGVATVQFHQKGDANKAYQAYNGKLIDNSKRLKVEIVMDPRQTKAPLANRIEKPAVAAVIAAAAATNQTKTATRRQRSRRGGRAGPSGAGRRPKKTVEDLDAEMTDYFETANIAPAS